MDLDSITGAGYTEVVRGSTADRRRFHLERIEMLAFSLPGGWEWIIVLVVALLICGSRLPSVMKSLGKSLREFKKGVRDAGTDDDTPPEQSSTKEPEPKD
jgi:sec-independent protein translocase protein TatA